MSPARLRCPCRPGGAPVLLPEEPSPQMTPAARPASRAREGSAPGEDLQDTCTRIAVSGVDLPGIAAGILEALVGATGAEAGLLLLRGRCGPMEPLAAGGAIPGPAAHLLARFAEETGHPVAVADLRSDRRIPQPGADDLLAQGFRAYLCQPLLAAGGTMGTLHLASGTSARFDSDSVRSAARAARVLALAVLAHRHRAETEQIADERAREVALLLEMSRSLGHLTGRAEVPGLLLENLTQLADPDLGAVLLVEGGRATITVQEEVPLPSGSHHAARHRVLSEFERAAGTVPPEIIVQENRSRSGVLEGAVTPSWRSELHLPLRRRGGVVGMVSVFATRTGAFGEARRRLLTTVAGLVSLTMDRLERTLEDERSRIESVVDAMGEGLLWVDPRGRLELANPAGRRSLLDLTGDAQPGELHRLGDVDLDRLRDEFAGGRRTRYQAEVGSGAAGRAYTLTASPVGGRTGEPKGMVLVLSDVTEQRFLQDQLLQAEKLSSLGEMISGVAHELNNPLTAVMGFAQLLEIHGGLEPEVLRKIGGITQQAVRCQRIVQNLLSFARDHHPAKVPVDFNGVVRSVMQLLEYQLRVDGIQISLDLSPELPAVRGDVHELQQVLLNLVTNAHHALQESPGQRRLSITTSATDDGVRLVMEDNGPGIAPEHLRRVFDPFFTTKGVGKGTGLGLSLAYGCIREHGGNIRADNRPGEGARFIIDLPTAGPAVEAPPLLAPAPEGPRAPRSVREILVADDEPAIATFIAEALRADGHRVDVVHDGQQARERIRIRRYDLIVTDLKMPRMSGRELYEDLARTDPAVAERIIFSTGDTVSRETVDFLRRFGDRCLTKPFRLTELQALIDRLLDS